MTISRKTWILITLVGLFCICVGKFLFPLYLWSSAPNSACAILSNNLRCSIRWSFGDFSPSIYIIFWKTNYFFLQSANEAFCYSLYILWIMGVRAFPSKSQHNFILQFQSLLLSLYWDQSSVIPEPAGVLLLNPICAYSFCGFLFVCLFCWGGGSVYFYFCFFFNCFFFS